MNELVEFLRIRLGGDLKIMLLDKENWKWKCFLEIIMCYYKLMC